MKTSETGTAGISVRAGQKGDPRLTRSSCLWMTRTARAWRWTALFLCGALRCAEIEVLHVAEVPPMWGRSSRS